MEPRVEFSQLQRPFVVPPGLNRGVPRDVRLTPGGKALVVVAVTLLVAAVVAGLVLHARGVQESDERRALTEGGDDAHAEVVRLWSASGDQKTSWVAYRFTVGEHAYEGQARVPLATWRALEVGAALPVRYDRARPTLNRPKDTDRRALPLWMPYLAATPLALGGLLCLFAVRTERELLANGRPAPAVVTKHHKHSSGHGGTHRSIAYAFHLMSGASASGKASTHGKQPAIGSVICVVYDPDRPRRSKPYPFELVRASVE